jgi:hypothetical protein
LRVSSCLELQCDGVKRLSIGCEPIHGLKHVFQGFWTLDQGIGELAMSVR